MSRIRVVHGARVHGNDRVAVLRRLDLAARGALLAAGLLAQWAMWMDAPAWVYPAAAVVLVVLSAESARCPFVAPAGARFGARCGWRRRNAYRIVACVALAEVCVGVVGTLPFSGAVPMAVPIGVLLVTVQGAQVQAIESRRDAVVGLVVVAAMLAGAGYFAHTARPAVVVLPAVVLVLIAAALLQRGSVLARTRAAIGLPRAAVVRTLLVPVTAATLIAALTFLTMPNSLRLGTSTNAGHVAHATAASTTATPGLDPGATRLDLRARGQLSGQPVFAVVASAPSYWQGEVFDTFDGSSWTATGAAGDGTQLATAATPGSDAQPSTSALPVRTDTVRVLSPRGLDVVVAPGVPTAYSGPGEMVAGADGTAHLTAVGVTSPWTYQVSSASSSSSTATLRAATGGDPADPKWTSVEPGLPARIRTLAAQLTASAPTRYDAVNAVDDYLQTHETYDLTSPIPALGQDAVDDFLFVSHRGFCEQFASAAVVMLRSTGIPARLVTGYSQGDLGSVPGERVMRGTDAHAWIQVWYPGVGWVTSDPTAASVLPPAAALTIAARDRHPLPLTAAVRAMPGGRLGWLVAIAGATVLVACAALLVGVRRRRRPRVLAIPVHHEPRPGDGPVLQAYMRLDAALGGQAREPEQTQRVVAPHLDTAGCSRAELAAALDCLERECYAIVAPAPADVAMAVDVFDRLHASLNGAGTLNGAFVP
ncbi:MAG TPA: transglutaminaseTgpA domain-containing protein [Acidothermaceae bacterium]